MRGAVRAAAAATTAGALFLTGCLAPLVSVDPDLARWAVVLDGGGNPRAVPSCWVGLTMTLTSTVSDPGAEPLPSEVSSRLCREDRLYLYDAGEDRLELVEPPDPFILLEATWDPLGRGVILLGGSLSEPEDGDTEADPEGEFRIYRYDPQERSWELLARIVPPPSSAGRFPSPRERLFTLFRSPSLSPDGRRVAYVEGGLLGAGPFTELRIVDRTTGEQQGSVSGVLAYEWLPSGSTLIAWRVEFPTLTDPYDAEVEVEIEGQILEVRCDPQGCTPERVLRSLVLPAGSPEQAAALGLFYGILPPTQFFDLAPDGSEVAVVALALRGGGIGGPVALENRLHVIPLQEEGEGRGFVRRGALLPRYSPSGRFLAAATDVRIELRRRPDPRSTACLAAPVPWGGVVGETPSPLDPAEGDDATFVCLDPGNFLALWERSSAPSGPPPPIPARTIELPHAPLELFWTAPGQLGYAYARGTRIGVRVWDLIASTSEDLTDRLRAAWEALPARTLRVPEDYPSVQAALEAARPRDVIRLAPGVYAEDVFLTQDVVLEGASPPSSRGSEGDGDGSVAEIRGRVRVIAPTPREVVLRNVRLVGDRVRARSGEEGSGAGLRAVGPVSLTLEGVTVEGYPGHGIVLEGEEGWGAAELRLREVRVLANGGCGLWIAWESVRVSAPEPIEMRANGVDLCGYAPISLRRPLVPPTDRARVRVPEDYASVQEAVDAVAPGGVVELGPGEFSAAEIGGATLGKPITLRGAGRERTKLVAERPGGILLSIPGGVTGVRIEGLSLVPGPEGQGMWVYGEAVLQDVVLQGHPRARRVGEGLGLRADGRARVRLERVRISRLGAGIFARGRAELELEDVHISGEPGPLSFGIGLDVGGSVRVQARGLVLRGVERAVLACKTSPDADCRPTLEVRDLRAEGVGIALWADGEADVRVRGGLIRDTSGFIFGAVRVEGSAVLRLEDVRILGERREANGFGLVAYAPPFLEGQVHITLKDVLISGYIVGLEIEGRVEAAIEDSKIAGNRKDGVVLDGEDPRSLALSPREGEPWVRLLRTEIRGNGTAPECRRVKELCVGVELRGPLTLELVDSVVRGNADWGIAAHLRACGYPEDAFAGTVRLLGTTRVEGNNTAGNHEGEVCLP